MSNTLKVRMKLKKSSSFSILNDTIQEVIQLVVRNGKMAGFSILIPDGYGLDYPGCTADFSIKEGEILDGRFDIKSRK